MENRSLKDLSLKELWELFPITLEPYNPEWSKWAESEIESLYQLLGDSVESIHHIGSTAVKGIYAKPIVDLLLLTDTNESWSDFKSVMERNGYICMSESSSVMSFNKGYTPAGYAEKVYHIHFRLAGDDSQILFRDYLNAHPDTADEYQRLKLGLLPLYKNDRDGYTDAKTDFVKRVLKQARNEYT